MTNVTDTQSVNILYIEDDHGLARLMQKKLHREGYRVDTAENTVTGGKMLAQKDYQLLLIDQNMPGQNGLDYVHELAEKSLLIPTIMVTASGSEELAVAIMKLGSVDYIAKDADGRYFSLLPSLIERLLKQERLQAQKASAIEALKTSEEKFRTIADYTYDWEEWMLPDGSYAYISPSCERITGYTQAEFYQNDVDLIDIINPEHREMVSRQRKEFLAQSDCAPIYLEFKITCKDGSERWVGRNCQSVITPEGKWLGRRTSYRDISRQKAAEAQLRILSLYDSLTGLYNRNYYEQELQRLKGGRDIPLGLIIFDIDGLKMVNDTLGHQSGDTLIKRTANILKDVFRESDMIARTGGDEFVVTLTRCDKTVMQEAIERTLHHINVENNDPSLFPLSVSMGYALIARKPIAGEIFDITALYKTADDNMYKDKASHQQFFNQQAFNHIVLLHEKRRVNFTKTQKLIENLSQKMAAVVTLSPAEEERLKLLVKYFDIGIVGVPEQLFSKQDTLTDEELDEIHMHCDVGCRLAKFFEALTPIANEILMHHKNWDGSGYPKVSSGEPSKISGILSIVVAYASMINERPFAKAMTHDEALKELQRCKKSQFCPEMVESFIHMFDASIGDN